MGNTKTTNNRFNLSRFVDAQAKEYNDVCAELRVGKKRGHWMWYIFPQLAGLGQSSTSRYYALSSLEEAGAYLSDPILGPRLIHCTQLVCDVHGRTVSDIFGYPDNLKFRSSMTLFSHATSENRLFLTALAKYFSGEFDPLTIRLL